MSKRLTREQVIESFKEAHGDLYDYSKVDFVNTSKKVEIICKYHGSFSQLTSDHRKGIGCGKCAREKNGKNKRYTLDQFLTKSRELHGDKFDYSKVNFETSNDDIEIICPIHGSFTQKVINHTTGRGCMKCAIEERAEGNSLGFENFIRKSKIIHGGIYDYSKVDYTNIKNDVVIICPKHGEFKQNPGNHMSGATCFKCSREKIGLNCRKNTEQFIKDATKVHGDLYDYSETEYIKATEPVDIICKKHGKFTINQAASHTNLNQGCPKCSQSKPEKFIQNLLNSWGLSYKVNNRKIIPPQELDFYIPDKNIAIEFNGLHHHSEFAHGKKSDYHLNKTIMCHDLGINLIHIFEDEYESDKNKIKFILKDILKCKKYKLLSDICVVKKVDINTTDKFLSKYKYYTINPYDKSYGLYYKNKLVFVSTFNGDNLIQYCSIGNFEIVGGLGKILQQFEKVKHKIDCRYIDVDLLREMFDIVTTISPIPWYFNDKFKRLPNYFEGCDRIWDCGYLLLEKPR